MLKRLLLSLSLAASGAHAQSVGLATAGYGDPITPSQITSTQNNYAPTGCANAIVYRLSSDASRSITGLSAATCAPAPGLSRMRVLENVGGFDIILESLDIGSSAANRFSFSTDVVLEAGNTIAIVYDPIALLWRPIGVDVSGAGPGVGDTFRTIGSATADTTTDTLGVTDSPTIDFTTTEGPPDDLTAIVVPGSIGTTHVADLDTSDITTGEFIDARVDGKLERDEVRPEWDAIVDCTDAATFGGTADTDTCQDRFYDVLEPLMEAAAGNAYTNQLPYKINVLLGDQTCLFSEATDYGELRTCLNIMPSEAFVGNRPTKSSKVFSGGVPQSGLHVNFDGTLRFNATGQTEAVCGLMIGGAFFAGFTGIDSEDCTGAGTPSACCAGAHPDAGNTCDQDTDMGGKIAGMMLTGNLNVQAMVTNHAHDGVNAWNSIASGAGRRIPTGNFESTAASSKTTFSPLCIAGMHRTDMSKFSLNVQHTGGDYDDIAFACMGHSWSNSAIGNIFSSSGNGGWIGPLCELKISTGGFEPTGGGSDRFGMVVGGPLGSIYGLKIPVSSTCLSGNCSARSSFAFGYKTYGEVVTEGHRTADIATFSGGIDADVYVEGGVRTSGLRNSECTANGKPWACCSAASTGTCVPKTVVLGAGYCASDNSMCVQNVDCPQNLACTASVTPYPCCTGSGTGNCSAPTNASCTSAGVPYICCTGSGTGTCVASQACQGFGANSTVDSNIRGTWTADTLLGIGPNGRSPYPESGQHIDAVSLNTRGGPDANNYCTAAGTPMACCTGSQAGTCADVYMHESLAAAWPPSGAPSTWGNPAVTLDFSGTNSPPVQVPGDYYGYVVPQPSFTDRVCTDKIGMLNQVCCDVEGADIGTCYRCDPDVGGASSSLCDQAGDWISF